MELDTRLVLSCITMLHAVHVTCTKQCPMGCLFVQLHPGIMQPVLSGAACMRLACTMLYLNYTKARCHPLAFCCLSEATCSRLQVACLHVHYLLVSVCLAFFRVVMLASCNRYYYSCGLQKLLVRLQYRAATRKLLHLSACHTCLGYIVKALNFLSEVPRVQE